MRSSKVGAVDPNTGIPYTSTDAVPPVPMDIMEWHATAPKESVLDSQIGGSHYQLPIQPIDYIVKNNLGYREGNVIKYVTRHKLKGTGKEDLTKAIHYLKMIIEEYELNGE